MSGQSNKIKTGALLLLLTAGAVLAHGYHPYAEDAEIYLPGVEKILNPRLFPVRREFFQSHASMTLFPNLIAASLRLTHLPLETGLLLWHVASIFLLLLACWQLSGILFRSERARWGAVSMIAALLTIPVAATALYILDQYLNPRNLAAFAVIFAVTRTLERKYGWALLWLAFAASVHPMMWTFGFSFCVLLVVIEKWEKRNPAAWPMTSQAVAGLGALFPFGISLDPPTSRAYHEAALLHGNHYIQRWQWYEDLGIFAPVALFWWFGKIARERGWNELDRVCRALIIYDIIFFCAALIVDLPPRFESLARLQPLRSLHLLYVVMLVIIGGLLGEFVLKNRVWRWLALFIPLGIGMFAAQRALFPASAHVEWPGSTPKNNPWAQSFMWIRQNTPEDAVFALDPNYMHIDGEDEIGFRAMAQRSRLADAIKDNGVVSMFPALADEWWEQVQAQRPWSNFQMADFERLKQKYEICWIVVQPTSLSPTELAEMNCPYSNAAVSVCRVP